MCVADDFKTIKGTLLKSVFSAVASVSDSGNEAKSPGSAIRDIIGGLASIAGKGKDEIVQIISREIGQAVAGVIKEPLLQILEERRIKVTIEFVAKNESKHDNTSKAKQAAPKRKSSTSKKTSRI
jgi:hypothetical protein